MSRMISRVVMVLALGACVSGCEPLADSGRPKTYPVSGTVTMNGSPVANAILSFQLADGSGSAAGVTDSQGRYELTTFAPGDGAVPGQYGVAITQFEKPPASTGVPDDHPDYNPNLPPFVAKNLLPERYAAPDSSGLTATITEGRNEGVNFELTE